MRLGYQLREPLDGSGWHQASRVLSSTGETIWIRLVDDGLRRPWFDIRVSGWNLLERTGSQERIQMQPSDLQGREDVRAAMDNCK